MKQIFILSILINLFFFQSYSQTDKNEINDNLYYSALALALDSSANYYQNINSNKDLYNVIVEYNQLMTVDLPTTIREFSIRYLNYNELKIEYDNRKKSFPIIRIHPIVNEKGILKIAFTDYWISFEKDIINYGLEGGCIIEFTFNCESGLFENSGVDFWGI
ncbi:hypothetical protein [Lentimicrobium sp. S6]|uniref:hypothetical protein n=1 Tax=Lentimicrobium sp. S6 TaxID=2735872 RepID=UPI0015547603|nr:hypothetical protein [Lentimicrobium sp. S6]NPD47977.1 hypothetical protein [Lentimicrobium sp. S6]